MSKLSFDPQQMPVEAVAGEPAVEPARLLPHALRARFAAPPRWEPELSDENRAALAALAAHADGPVSWQDAARAAAQAWRSGGAGGPRALTPAAVLMPLVERGGALHVLLTHRTAHLTDHAGQISFPGGRAEPFDADPVATALRETEEEIGLARAHAEVLGSLPEYVTITGYRVTPVVALLHGPFELRADPLEVAEIFEAPLAFLMDGAHHERRSALIGPGGRGAGRTFYAMPYQGHFIWGATAGMLRNLFHFLRA